MLTVLCSFMGAGKQDRNERSSILRITHAICHKHGDVVQMLFAIN